MKNLFFEEPEIPELKEEHTLVDMHYHTEYSADCSTKLQEVLKFAAKLEIGVAITDHNSVKGNLIAQKQRKVMVIPAVEVTTKNDKDLLIYFNNKSDMISFNEKVIENHIRKHTKFRFNKLNLPTENILELARDYNALVSIAHPFTVFPKKSFYYFNREKNNYLMEMIDAIESINAIRNRKENLASYGWALSEGKGFTAGSDGHRLNWLGKALTCCKAESVEEFLDSIKKKKNILIGKEMKFPSKLITELTILKNRV
ncbi:hypothetical protein CMO90_03430 [Candidatus Woesearchaeota archaeon]|jgi:PHP family Zn ribbon phosphoesterase|nr:hypothetical protein [Candidatus Woesearchaeota archaeon]|tara:strand:+ start:600 stop:1370 length:771 start_codon:yes stop_codon:yes gene_type:complete